MATKVSPLTDTLQSTLVVLTSLNVAGVDSVTGGSGTLHVVEVVNGDSDAIFIKLYDDGNPTMGTTAPDVVFEVAGSATRVVWIDGGLSFVNGLSVSAAEESGTASSTNPSSVTVRLGIS